MSLGRRATQTLERRSFGAEGFAQAPIVGPSCRPPISSRLVRSESGPVPIRRTRWSVRSAISRLDHSTSLLPTTAREAELVRKAI